MTVKEAVKYIISKSKDDESLLTDTKRFWAYLSDLSPEYKEKGLNVIKRSLDSEFLELCFKSEDDLRRRVFQMKYRLENQGIADKWINFIIDSFFSPLGWKPMEEESSLPQQKQEKQKRQTQKQQTQKQQTQNQQTQNQQNKQEQTQFSNQASWTCSCCTVNTTKFCGNCGLPKPVPKTSTWTCSCGFVNTTKFCGNCGKPNGQQTVHQAPDQQIPVPIPPNSKQATKSTKQAKQAKQAQQPKQATNYIEVTLDEQVLKQLGYYVEHKYYKYKRRFYEQYIIKQNDNDLEDLIIPSTYRYSGKDYKIIQIGEKIFQGYKGLTSVTIPDSVTEIREEAFSYCSSLTNITIPNSVKEIGNSAFSGCSSLTNITIPDSVKEIREGAFSYCSSLTNITIPNSVKEIGNSAFSGCSSLTNITIPDSVKEIREGAFFYCSSLTNITIPESVTKIDNSAFSCCSSLTNITIPDSVKEIGFNAFDGVPHIYYNGSAC